MPAQVQVKGKKLQTLSQQPQLERRQKKTRRHHEITPRSADNQMMQGIGKFKRPT